jgi:GTP cyclohydrolase I
MQTNMNNQKIEEYIKNILVELGENTEREGLINTPKRVAKSYKSLFSGYGKNPSEILTVFDDEHYDEMIVVKDVEFYSFCEHHMLPFFGKAHIGYIPNGKIIGLSKIPRIVDIFSRRLQNQERITQQIATSLMELLQPKGVGVVLEAQHFCMMARGVEKQNSVVRTSAMKGIFKERDNTRAEFLELIK